MAEYVDNPQFTVNDFVQSGTTRNFDGIDNILRLMTTVALMTAVKMIPLVICLIRRPLKNSLLLGSVLNSLLP